MIGDIWVIHGPTCSVVITLKVMGGGMLSMRISDAATGGPPAPLRSNQLYGLMPEQCDQFEDALREARASRSPSWP